MSKHTSPITAVLEWSPRAVLAFDAKSRQTKEFPNAAAAAAELGARPVVVAVSRRSVFVRTMRVPNASEEDINMIVRMKLPELFPLPAQDLSLDIELTPDINVEGRLAIIVAMPSIELRRLNEEVRGAGFRIHRVVPAAYGSVLLAESLQKPNGAIVSKDESLIGIDIVQDGTLRYSRVAAPGLNAAAEVCRTFSVAGLPCGLIISTDSIQIPEADLVSAISPLEALSEIWPDQMGFSLELPEVLALRKSRERSKRLKFAGALFVAAILFGLYAFFDYSDKAAIVSQANALAAADLDRATKREQASEADSTRYAGLMKSLKRGFEPGQKLMDTLTLVSNDVPDGAWLTGITVERGKQLMLRGTARDSTQVQTYLSRLTGEDRLRDVTLVYATNGLLDQTPVVQFNISAFPVGNLPLVDSKTAGSK